MWRAHGPGAGGVIIHLTHLTAGNGSVSVRRVVFFWGRVALTKLIFILLTSVKGTLGRATRTGGKGEEAKGHGGGEK